MLRITYGLLCVVMFGGCAVVTVADAAVSVTATAVKTTVNVAGAVVDAAIPDGDDKKESKE